MADKTIYMHDVKTNTWLPVLFHDNGDGTYSQVVAADVII